MDSTAAIQLRNALSAVHNSQLSSSSEKPTLPADLNTALSLLTRPIPAISTTFPQFNPFTFPDPSTLFAFSQQLRSNLSNYQTTAIVAAPVHQTPTTTTIPGTIPTPCLGPTPLKRPNRVQQSASSPPSCSSSVASSSSPPQHSPHRKQAAPVPDDKKDEAYYERRRKNNDAAKRSRDARRQKEEAVAARAAFLEQENIQLRSQVVLLKNETAKLQLMLFSKPELLDSKISPLSSQVSDLMERRKSESTVGETNVN